MKLEKWLAKQGEHVDRKKLNKFLSKRNDLISKEILADLKKEEKDVRWIVVDSLKPYWERREP